MRSIASVIVFDILLGIVHIFLDLYLAHSYFENADVWWGVLTLLIIAVPGTMGKGVLNRTIIETNLLQSFWVIPSTLEKVK